MRNGNNEFRFTVTGIDKSASSLPVTKSHKAVVAVVLRNVRAKISLVSSRMKLLIILKNRNGEE
jgi:hypothetical protein